MQYCFTNERNLHDFPQNVVVDRWTFSLDAVIWAYLVHLYLLRYSYISNIIGNIRLSNAYLNRPYMQMLKTKFDFITSMPIHSAIELYYVYIIAVKCNVTQLL